MPKIYISPDGRKYEYPDDLTSTEKAEIRREKLRPVDDDWHGTKDLLKSSLSGGIESVPRSLLIGGDLFGLAGRGVNALFPGAIDEEKIKNLGAQPWIDAFRDSPLDKTLKSIGLEATYEPETTAGRYGKAITEAVVGAPVFGGLMSIPGRAKSAYTGIKSAASTLKPSNIGINAAAGGAAELGFDWSRGFDERRQGNLLVSMMLGMGTSAGLSTIKGGLAPNLDQHVFNSTKDMKPADWDAAGKSLNDFRRSGSQTFTLADLPEFQPRIGGVTQEISNAAGGEAMRLKLSTQERMNKDIPNLFKSVLDDVAGPRTPSDPRDLAALLSKKGELKMDNLQDIRSRQLAGTLQSAPPLDPWNLVRAATPIRSAAVQGGNQATGMQAALAKAEQALLGKDAPKQPTSSTITPPVLNVESLSQNVKNLRNIPMSDSPANPRGSIMRFQGKKAGELADKSLRTASPEYDKAMTQYADFTENFVKPMERRLPGQIRGIEPTQEALLGKLRAVPPGKLQAELNTLKVTPEEALDLAHALGTKLGTLGNLTKASPAAKLDRELFIELVEYGNPALTGGVRNKLDVADSLSRLTSEHGSERLAQNLSKTPWDWLSPFSTAGYRGRMRTTEKEVSKLTELVANPTFENITKLRKMAQVDPRARRALEWISSLVAASQAGGNTTGVAPSN